ncbi:MAG: hypothetical protein U7123_14855 [Potamolinea sp.]
MSCLTFLSVLHKLSPLPPISRSLLTLRSQLNGKRLFWSGVMSSKTIERSHLGDRLESL